MLPYEIKMSMLRKVVLNINTALKFIHFVLRPLILSI